MSTTSEVEINMHCSVNTNGIALMTEVEGTTWEWVK